MAVSHSHKSCCKHRTMCPIENGSGVPWSPWICGILSPDPAMLLNSPALWSLTGQLGILGSRRGNHRVQKALDSVQRSGAARLLSPSPFEVLKEIKEKW